MLILLPRSCTRPMASSLFKSPFLCRKFSSHFGLDDSRSYRRSVMQTSSIKSTEGLPVSLGQSKVSMVTEGREASSSADSSVQDEISLPVPSSSKINLPPRMCTLREFGEGTVAVDSDARVSSFFESLAANIEFSYMVQHWEILSGRLAMMVFASALLLEAITGNSVFEKMDPQRILEVCGAILASIVVAAGFAIALQAKTRVAYTVSKGYENMMNALIDNVFDSLLFDREES